MKGIVWIIVAFAILAACGWLPFESHDVAELSPVETLAADFDGGTVTLTGDGGQQGSGATWDEAVADFKNSADGVVFLQTAQKILLTGDWTQGLRDVADSVDLRPAAELFQVNVAEDVKAIGEYLQTRTSPVTLAQLRAALLSGEGVSIPKLRVEGEKVRLEDE